MLEVHAILQRQRCNENITKKTGTLSDAYFAGGISTFDMAYKCFPEFELPFIVISLIVLLFPLILFVGYIIISRIVVKALKRKCKRRIQKVKKCLNNKVTPQD